MRIVSIGDLVTDYYYKNGKLIGINGGMTSHNIIANLAKAGINTAVYGVCGNDLQGKIAIKSLEILKVDVNNIKVLNSVKTRCFHVKSFEEDGKVLFESKKKCPFCNKKNWYKNSLIDTSTIIKNINDDDILVFDNLNTKNQTVIDSVCNKKIIDLGQYFEFKELSNKDILDSLSDKFEIVNFNERVSKYLLNRLKINTNIELYNLLKPNFMIITRGEKGAIFVKDGKEYNFKLIFKGEVTDPSGAGDAFVASIIKECIKNNFKYDTELFEMWYEKSNKCASKVVSKMGARGHINTLFKIKQINEKCTCEHFEYSERKKIKRCNININNLKPRIINAINSSVSDKIETINFNINNNCLFIGTGGSYAGAYFAARIINLLYGCNTYSMYPRDVLYRNNKNIDKVILFSHSGTTSDIINSVKDLDKENVYIITKGELQKIVLKSGISKNNILSYRTASNRGKERGFLSFEGAVAPAAIFLKHYLYKTNSSVDCNKFIDGTVNYWYKQMCKLITKDIIKNMKEHNLINLFRGDYTNAACFDLESKIIESGIFNCIIHEKKNFSHGRFINFENLNNTCSIYFKQKTTSKYESELLEYLGNETIIIESRYDGILAEFDLLIASQFIIYYIGKVLDIDVSKPKYTEDALKIYFYKGDL